MVLKIPSTWKAISRRGSVTSRKTAKMRIVSVAMHAMSFSLMTEETSIGRKLSFHTLRDLAAVRFEMGVQVFAVYGMRQGQQDRELYHLLVSALLFRWLVRTRYLFFPERAMV